MDGLKELSWDTIRRGLNKIAQQDGNWAGIPLVIEDIPVVVEPRYPYAALNGQCLGEPIRNYDPYELGAYVHNSWYSVANSATVYVCSDTPDGKRYAVMLPEWGGKRLIHWIDTLGASRAWTIDMEVNALEALRGLIPAHAFEYYFLTGTFLETSKQSKIMYLFRKLRPTIALRDTAAGMQIRSVLCLHPIGYYRDTWAGVMTPTDDVIAHLLLMRADEHRFWAKANHHPLWSAGAGI